MADARALRICAGAALDLILAVPWFVLLPAAAVMARFLSQGNREAPPRVLVGTTPLPSVVHNVRAMRSVGYACESAVTELYALLPAQAFDHVLCDRQGRRGIAVFLRLRLRSYLFFVAALRRYDVFHFFFDGGVLRHTVLSRVELPLLRLAGKAVVVMPYGSDAFVYDRVPDGVWRHALIGSYPGMGRVAARVEARIRRMCRHADAVLGCLVHFICLPRWDMLPLVCYPTDVADTAVDLPAVAGPIRIAHAPNHRPAKGTPFVLDAVRRLQADGHDIRLDLIEGVPHDEALRRLQQADIVIEQLHFGYALTALEGMARGKIVISNLAKDGAHRLFRLFSYLDECPIVSAEPETLTDILRRLCDDRTAWPELGRRMRTFVEERHSYQAAAQMWQAIHRKVWFGEAVDLIGFYAPHVGGDRPR